MKQKKKLMVLTLILVSSLLMTTISVQASGNSISEYSNTKTKNVQLQTRKKAFSPQIPIRAQLKTTAKITKVIDYTENIQLDEVNDEILAEIDTLVEEYEQTPEEKRPTIRGLWVVWARGLSWKTNSIPETSETAPEGIPMGTKFYAKAILGTQEYTLYKLARGIIGHDGERYQVDGYALYKKATGRFYLVLDGEGVSLQAVGRVYGPNADLASNNGHRCLRLSMKGRISINGDGYVFALRGIAHRRFFLKAIAVRDSEITSSS